MTMVDVELEEGKSSKGSEDLAGRASPVDRTGQASPEDRLPPRPRPHKVIRGYSEKVVGQHDLEIDEEGIRRTGGIWSTFLLVITAVIGSGVLSLPYSMAMLGWVAGGFLFLLFAWITLYTSQLLADCHIVDGRRTRCYITQVEAVMGPRHKVAITWIQQVNLVLTALAYSITATYALRNVATSVCEGRGMCSEDESGDVSCGGCFNSFWKWAVIHGTMQVLFSYIPNMDSSLWPCLIGALMSIGYSSIALGRAAAEGQHYGTVTGISGLSTSDKTFGVMNAFGAILFAYNFSMILPEIQDTIRDGVAGGPIRAMRRTVNWSVAIMVGFYLAVAVSGYMAYGNDVAGNILNSFQTPRWLVDLANIMVIVHLIPAYQVWSQPFFFFLESNQQAWRGKRSVPRAFRGWTFRAWFRPAYVAAVTALTICVPFFSFVMGAVGAAGFWPATVYYPVEMWIRLYRPSKRHRFWLEVLNVFCLVCSIVALVGSVQQIIVSWSSFQFFAP